MTALVPTPDSRLPPPWWPLRHASRIVPAGGVDWHVQQLGEGPDLLLVHGTAGSTHGWAAVATALARSHRVTAVDLPGHGFTTEAPDHAMTLPGMAALLGSLLRALGPAHGGAPVLVAGHSAGAALLLRAVLDGQLRPQRIAGFNPALIPPPESWVRFGAPLLAPFVTARALAGPLTRVASRGSLVDRLLASAGAHPIGAEAQRCYRALFASPRHVRAAMAMMARWDLPTLLRDAAALTVPFEGWAGAEDRWVPAAPLARSVRRIPGATLHLVPGAGHLLPEERPQAVVDALTRWRP